MGPRQGLLVSGWGGFLGKPPCPLPGGWPSEPCLSQGQEEPEAAGHVSACWLQFPSVPILCSSLNPRGLQSPVSVLGFTSGHWGCNSVAGTFGGFL